MKPDNESELIAKIRLFHANLIVLANLQILTNQGSGIHSVLTAYEELFPFLKGEDQNKKEE